MKTNPVKTHQGPSVLHRLYEWAQEQPNDCAQRYKHKGSWKSISAKEYWERVYYLSLYLKSIGLNSQHTGSILAYNSAEWVTLELALMLAGPRSAGLYPNSTSKDIDYILNHTESVLLGVQNKEYFKKIDKLPAAIRTLIVFDEDESFHPLAIGFLNAIEKGKALKSLATEKQLLDAIDVNKEAFMIYTSGTTGNPKGAILSHDNLAYTSDLVNERWKLPQGGGALFSFLPLCHIAEKLHSIGVGITMRYTVSYCSKFENVSVEIPDVQPTLLLCVPRVWEKMMEGVLNKIERGKGLKKNLALWALGVGERISKTKYTKESPSLLDILALPLAEKLVLSKVKHALGLSRAKLLASGAAPLPVHVAKWFRIFGLEIYECYGLTETAGVVSITLPHLECAGTVGKPLEGCEFMFADDGEILSKGRHIFLGYFKNPEATAETLKDGWFHTGDLGKWNENGLVQIVGRKREIMKTSGGKMVAPVPIEERLKVSSFISQVCMVGDNQKFFSALVTLSEGTLADLKSNPKAFDQGVLKDPEMLAKLKKEFDSVNATLASYEQIKRFAVIDREFSIADQEMTPTMKMKRSIIEKNFQSIIRSFYE